MSWTNGGVVGANPRFSTRATCKRIRTADNQPRSSPLKGSLGSFARTLARRSASRSAAGLLAVGAERLPVAVGEIAKGLGGVPFATQFTYGEMGPSGFAAEEGEARVEDEQCNLMLNLLVFGREPQAE